jgi:hypothetical protein
VFLLHDAILNISILFLDSHAASIVPFVIYLTILALMLTPVFLVELIFAELLLRVPPINVLFFLV